MTMDEETQRLRKTAVAIKIQDLTSLEQIFGGQPEYLLRRTHLGSWLEYAASYGAYSSAKKLIDLGLSPNFTPDSSGRLPISSAAMLGDVRMVQLLLDNGSDIKTDKPDHNPLFSAIHNGHIDVVRLLIERGADPLIRYGSKQGDTVAFALEYGKQEIADLMAELASGGDVRRKQEILAHALNVARGEGPLRPLQILPADDVAD